MTDLEKYLENCRKLRFTEYGQWDCCIFCHGWMIKKGFSSERPSYCGRTAAMKAYRQFCKSKGVTSINEYLDKELGPSINGVSGCVDGAIAARKVRVSTEFVVAFGIAFKDHIHFVDFSGMIRLPAEENDNYWYSDALKPKPV